MAHEAQNVPNVAEPAILELELSAFHEAHFGAISKHHFTATFLQPTEVNDNAGEEEEDTLGYYSDGMKRTLTDEQIAVFRHSEIEALLREKRYAEERRGSNPATSASTPGSNNAYTEDVEANGETYERPTHKKRKKRKPKKEVKPDLRKRTWDVVDQGVVSLSYEDADTGAMTGRGEGPQRKRVSYEDI